MLRVQISYGLPTLRRCRNLYSGKAELMHSEPTRFVRSRRISQEMVTPFQGMQQRAGEPGWLPSGETRNNYPLCCTHLNWLRPVLHSYALRLIISRSAEFINSALPEYEYRLVSETRHSGFDSRAAYQVKTNPAITAIAGSNTCLAYDTM